MNFLIFLRTSWVPQAGKIKRNLIQSFRRFLLLLNIVKTTCNEVHSDLVGITSGPVTLACAHLGSLEMLNLNAVVSWDFPPWQDILGFTWLDFEFSSTASSMGLNLHRLSSPSRNSIWDKANGWSLIIGDNGQEFSSILCSIFEEKGAGTFQTKIQPSPHTWKQQYSLTSYTLTIYERGIKGHSPQAFFLTHKEEEKIKFSACLENFF